MGNDSVHSYCWSHPLGSVLVLIPPLLVGSDSAGTLRKDYRIGVYNTCHFMLRALFFYGGFVLKRLKSTNHE